LYKHALPSLTALIGIVLGMGNSHNKLLKKLSSTNEYVIYYLVINSHNSDLEYLFWRILISVLACDLLFSALP
jgi:hypothetical protein